MTQLIKERNSLPPVSGCYLSIIKDNKEIHISSVPSFVLGADRYRDSVSENDDEFKDDEGNEFLIKIYSSDTGVEWMLNVSPINGDVNALRNRIRMEYQGNDY